MHQLTNQPVFPFLNYYPFMFHPQWMNPSQVPSQRSAFCSSSMRSHVSSIQNPENPLIVQKPDRLKQAKQVNQPRTRPIEKKQSKKKKDREDDYSRKKQKKDRNLPSNIFKGFVNFMHIHPKMIQYIRKHCPRQIQINPEVFLEKFRSTIKYGQSYVRPSAIQELWSEGVFNQEEALVFRILVHKYMNQQFPVVMVHQCKLKKSQKMTYLKLSRMLYKQLTMNFFK